MEIDALNLSKAWLTVSAASARDNIAALDRTVRIEQYPTGLRLTATDSFVALATWVPAHGHELDPEPELDEVPHATAIAWDQDNRARAFFGYLLKISKKALKDKSDPIDVRVTLNVPWQAPETPKDELQLEGFEALAVVFEYVDHERLQLEVYEANYPNVSWLLSQRRAKVAHISKISLSSANLATLVKACKPWGEPVLGCWFSGVDRAIAVELLDIDYPVYGLAMPARWDFETNSYRQDEPEAEAS